MGFNEDKSTKIKKGKADLQSTIKTQGSRKES